MKNKKHLFFDLDDTLWDFSGNSAQVLEKLFIEHKLKQKLKINLSEFLRAYKEVNLSLWSQLYKKQIDKQHLRNHRFNEVFKRFSLNDYDLNITISEEYMKVAPQGKLLKQDCIETLQYLKQKYKLHIITNGFSETQAIKIDGCGLRSYFTNIIVSEEYNLVKPEKEIFRLAESFAGASPDECVMIGDSLESDIKGALNVGWEAIYYSDLDTANHTGWHIRRLKELQEIF